MKPFKNLPHRQIRAVRSSKRTEHRDLQELQSRHEGAQGAHLSQEAKMALPEVQEGPNAGAQAALARVRSSSPTPSQ